MSRGETGESLPRWEVVFYETAGGRRPVTEFLEKGCTHRQAAKLLDTLTMLEEAGFSLGPPWLKKVDEDLWELRVQADKARLRVLFYRYGNRFVLLHGLKKQRQRLSESDLRTARGRCKDYRTRATG